MSGRHQPLMGADSPDSYVRHPFKVTVHADYGARFTVYVRAIGWHEATGLAIDAAERSGHFDVRPGVPQQITEAEYEQGRAA